MSDKKAVFFDADGTICDMEKVVPDSAVESIKKLVANVSGTDSVYRNHQCMWGYHRKRRKKTV